MWSCISSNVMNFCSFCKIVYASIETLWNHFFPSEKKWKSYHLRSKKSSSQISIVILSNENGFDLHRWILFHASDDVTDLHRRKSVVSLTAFVMVAVDKKRLSINSLEAQRAIVFSLWKSKQSGTSIRRHLEKTAGVENAMSLRSIQRWCQEFRDGRTNLDREPGQGRTPIWTTVTLRARILELLEDDAWLTAREMEVRLEAPRATIFNVMKTEMGLSKLSARWVLRLLTEDLKQSRMEACQRKLRLSMSAEVMKNFFPASWHRTRHGSATSNRKQSNNQKCGCWKAVIFL